MVKEIPRAVTPLLTEVAAALRVVVVNGPRQAGKTTLLRQIQRHIGGVFESLDDRVPSLVR